MSHIASDNHTIEIEVDAVFDPSFYEVHFQQYQNQFVAIGPLGSLYGVLTILSIVSCYALFKKRNGKIQPTVILLCLTILALFIFTTIYMVTCTLFYLGSSMLTFIYSGAFLTWDVRDPNSDHKYWISINWNLPNVHLLRGYQLTQGCASAATLTINVILGDAIVCWRACSVWHKNRSVQAACSVLLLATIIIGAVDTSQSCQPKALYALLDNNLDSPGSLFEDIPIGSAACVLSLSINILATLLVAYKAWLCRRRLRGYLVTKIGGSQVEKLLALLIESRAVYSAIWAVVVAFQFETYKWFNASLSLSTSEYRFIGTFSTIANGALVPVVAIYPAVIIVLVALNRSHIEKGLTQHLDSLPTPHIQVTSIATSTFTTSLHESRSHLTIDIQDSERGDGLESTRMCTNEERKDEDIPEYAG